MSDAVADPEQPTAPVKAPPAPAPASAAEPNLIDRARAALRTKPDLQAENRSLQSQISDFRSQLAEQQAQIESLTANNLELAEQNAEVTKLVAEAELTAKTATEQATEMVAATGQPVEDLPEQDVEEQSFEARFEAAKAAGPGALSAFMTENRTEVRRHLRKS
jgi:Asp-tRNA(Asn)/Glu-tRNA(Gln) amidotransferase B subunit